MNVEILIIGGVILLILWKKGLLSNLFGKAKEPVATSTTGHPVLDLMVEAASEKYASQPRVVDVINDFAATVLPGPTGK